MDKTIFTFGCLATMCLLPAQAWSSPSRAAPPGRFDHALAYDPVRQVTVLFGGAASTSWTGRCGSWVNVLGDTWELSQNTWQLRLLPSSPPARSGHAVVYDAHRGVVLLYGGAGFGGPAFDDTWSYDGVTWSQAPPGPSPGVRAWHAMAFDPRRRRTVLFGGLSGTLVLADTWEYDGSSWSPVQMQTAPAARQGHAMAYDSARSRCVVFGGDGGGGALADTWEYDGATWLQIATAHSPAARYSATMTFDAVHGTCRLFGGLNIAPHIDTWEYDGSDWQRVFPGGAAPQQFTGAMVHDVDRDVAVYFGGRGSTLLSTHATCGLQFLTVGQQADRELLPVSTADWALHGQGCQGSAGVPNVDRVGASLPALGSVFALQVTSLPVMPGVLYVALGFGVASWNGRAVPVDLAFVGMPGCDLWIAPEPGLGLLLAHGGAGVTFSVSLPAAPWLAGRRFGAQAIVLDPQSASGFGAVSNAGVATVY